MNSKFTISCLVLAMTLMSNLGFSGMSAEERWNQLESKVGQSNLELLQELDSLIGPAKNRHGYEGSVDVDFRGNVIQRQCFVGINEREDTIRSIPFLKDVVYSGPVRTIGISVGSHGHSIKIPHMNTDEMRTEVIRSDSSLTISVLKRSRIYTGNPRAREIISSLVRIEFNPETKKVEKISVGSTNGSCGFAHVIKCPKLGNYKKLSTF